MSKLPFGTRIRVTTDRWPGQRGFTGTVVDRHQEMLDYEFDICVLLDNSLSRVADCMPLEMSKRSSRIKNTILIKNLWMMRSFCEACKKKRNLNEGFLLRHP